MRPILSLAILLLPISLFAQSALEKVRAYRRANEDRIVREEFCNFLRIPNVATDRENIRRNAAFLVQLMKLKGIANAELLESENSEAPPVVFGQVLVPGASKTVIFYAHYDGQPVNPSLWAEGLDPFIPVLVPGRIEGNKPIEYKEGMVLPDDYRIYARGSSDDKAGVVAILSAYEALIKTGQKPGFSIKFFFDGEEEQGSPHLDQILKTNRNKLSSDLWIICDGPVHASGARQVVFGVRGDTHIRLKMIGPKDPLHSGHYGNWVPNPVMELVQLLASMKNNEGMVTIKGFYDDMAPLTALERGAMERIPDMQAELKKRIGFAAEEMKGRNLLEAISLPSLNINGIESSNSGTIQANIIPVSATAVLDLRLVPGIDWKKQQQKVIDHVISQGFFVTEQEPTEEERSKYPKIVVVTRSSGYNAQRTPLDWPVAQQVVKAVQQASPRPVLEVPTMGGSLPLYIIENLLNAKPLIVPIANPDNNQHAENENIRIGHLREGIDIMASLMLMKF